MMGGNAQSIVKDCITRASCGNTIQKIWPTFPFPFKRPDCHGDHDHNDFLANVEDDARNCRVAALHGTAALQL